MACAVVMGIVGREPRIRATPLTPSNMGSSFAGAPVLSIVAHGTASERRGEFATGARCGPGLMAWPLMSTTGSAAPSARPSPFSVWRIASVFGGGTAERRVARSFAVRSVLCVSHVRTWPHEVRCAVEWPLVRARFSCSDNAAVRPNGLAPLDAMWRCVPRPSEVLHASSSCQPCWRVTVVEYCPCHAGTAI